jgi:hypothetical protein
MQAWTERITLRHVAARPQAVRLREPCGSDELALAGVDTLCGAAWLDALLERSPCRAAELSASDRDALYAALHRGLWGDRIVASPRCAGCGAQYDLSFELSALQRSLLEQAKPVRVDAPRTLHDDAGGTTWRLPSAEEEDAAAQAGGDEGRARLAAAITGTAVDDVDTLARRLESLAPLIDVDLDSRCAECGHAQVVRFDIQSYVLQRILDQRDNVLDEVHALAAAYGWSLAEIGGLPRSMRRALAQRLQVGATG